MTTISRIALLSLLALGAAGHAGAELRNAFEWLQVAPVVVAGKSLGEDGRFVEFQVARTLRGDPRPADVLQIDVRFANRERDRLLHPKALRLDAGMDYVVLLETVQRTEKGKPPYFRIVRGVAGARELPLEGREAYLAALQSLIEIQDLGSDAVIWDRLARMLGETDALLLDTALDQFLKFRRGDPELLLAVRPLLDHPQAELRAKAARLSGQILERFRGRVGIPEEDALRAALVGRARRDSAVPVRVAATEALAGFPAGQLGDVLETIAEADPDQQVRYAAEVILLERRRQREDDRPAPRPRGQAPSD